MTPAVLGAWERGEGALGDPRDTDDVLTVVGIERKPQAPKAKPEAEPDSGSKPPRTGQQRRRAAAQAKADKAVERLESLFKRGKLSAAELRSAKRAALARPDATTKRARASSHSKIDSDAWQARG